MDENEFALSPVGSSINDYLDAAGSIMQLTGTIYHLFDAAVADALSPQLRSTIGEKYADVVVDSAREHKEANHARLHSLVVLASWAALETLITDLCAKMLRYEPELLQTEPFKKLKLSPEIVLLDRPAQLDCIADLAFARGAAANYDGKGKFESQLSTVGLGGDVPDDLAQGMAWANAVRNVMAHNGSRVDSKFLERCPDSGYSLGDKIALRHQECAGIVLGLQTYTFIVMNRFRMKHGLRPLQCNQSPVNKFRDSFNQMYPGAITAQQLTEPPGTQ